MKVQIHFGGNLIGEGDLISFDPPMGVAFGPFSASPLYDCEVHAYQIGERFNPAGQDIGLTAFGPDGPIECAGVGILDVFEDLSERQITLLGVVEFEELFG